METTSTDVYNTPTPEPGILLNLEAQYYLKMAGKWASFLGIVGFVFCALILLGALSAGSIVAAIATIYPSVNTAGIATAIIVYYVLIALVYFIFSLFLYQFGSKIKLAVAFADPLLITSALAKLRSFFKLWGIFTIIALVLIMLAIAGGVMFAIKMASAIKQPVY